MLAARHFEEGPVRVTATTLVTPAGSWPLLAIAGARPVRIEPEPGVLQGVFVLALIAGAVGLKRLFGDGEWALAFLGAGAALGGIGVSTALRRRPAIALQIDHDGSTVEVWRSADEAAVLRVVRAIEQARPQSV